MRIPRRLTVLALTLLTPIVLGGQAADPLPEVEQVLRKVNFTAADLTMLQGGMVVARANAEKSGEIVTQAAVRILAPHAQVVSYYGQMISYVDGQVIQGFGQFSTPALLSDVAKLTFDRNDIDALKSCRAGSCDVRIGGAGLSAMQAAIDWKAPDYPDRVNEFARKTVVDYVTAYRARGDEALVTYNDNSKAVSLKSEWSSLLSRARNVHAFVPELARYLSGFPNDSLAGARDIIYWIKEDYGQKPIVSVVHAVMYTPKAGEDRTVVAQKYIYTSHYYDASLAVAWIASGTENGAPVTYILYSNRSRGDLLRGGFGGIARSVAEKMAREGAEQTLSMIKLVLEGRR
ncbi:MAG TPA: hypothetical protein VL914_10855 [Vicinamibacterales bacterium]|nr:hypothetical protein [Vicinamibacterales bacterium]